MRGKCRHGNPEDVKRSAAITKEADAK